MKNLILILTLAMFAYKPPTRYYRVWSFEYHGGVCSGSEFREGDMFLYVCTKDSTKFKKIKIVDYRVYNCGGMNMSDIWISNGDSIQLNMRTKKILQYKHPNDKVWRHNLIYQMLR